MAASWLSRTSPWHPSTAMHAHDDDEGAGNCSGSRSGTSSPERRPFLPRAYDDPPATSSQSSPLSLSLVLSVLEFVKCAARSRTLYATLLLALALSTLALSSMGIYALVALHTGRLMRTPVYTSYDIAQAGYARQQILDETLLLPPSSPSGKIIGHHGGLQGYAQQEHSTPYAPLYGDMPFPDRLEGAIDGQAQANGGGELKSPSLRPQQHSTTIYTTHTFPSVSSALEPASFAVSNHSTSSTTWPSSPSATAANAAFSSDSQHVLILTPLRNAAHLLSTYFSHLTSLSHPRSNTSLGFLLSDEEDSTGPLVAQWCADQASRNEYRRITLLRKDFGLYAPQGQGRHGGWIQAQRRALMARARTTLLTSTIQPDVDWVLWLDSDVAEMPSSIVEDLLRYGVVERQSATEGLGHAGDGVMQESKRDFVHADIITPNIMLRRSSGHTVKGYDLNNWADTPTSLEMKKHLHVDHILHEGDRAHPTHRHHLADDYVAPNVTLDPFLPHHPVRDSSDQQQQQQPPSSSSSNSNLYDPDSPAYIGRQTRLDGVGGVATLVRASVHLFGGVFPSWNVDHAVETEGFGLLAKKLGAVTVGLPNYVVLHRL